MSAKDFLRLGVPLGQATRFATDFVSRFILSSGANGFVDRGVKHVTKGGMDWRELVATAVAPVGNGTGDAAKSAAV